MREYYVKYDIYDKLIEKNIDGDKKNQFYLQKQNNNNKNNK